MLAMEVEQAPRERENGEEKEPAAVGVAKPEQTPRAEEEPTAAEEGGSASSGAQRVLGGGQDLILDNASQRRSTGL